ncbi:MAG: endonuclease/exonuclease/phosphatase family protein [Alphaproteobacteria bacterium]|nr:endonuclease/exonuclease/phosphatase family protein [Alphaproteobacteria bacterium]
MRIKACLIAISGLCAAACSAGPEPLKRPIVLASWNLEHLAEADGSGCRPRTEADYAALRDRLQLLSADIIAFQEVENLAAARRVFDPDVYDIVIEERPGSRGKPGCNGRPGLFLNRQAVGFAVKKNIEIERRPDVVDLQLGDPNLRSGVEIVVTEADGRKLTLLAVHLKSGCASGEASSACETLRRQTEALRSWVQSRAGASETVAVMGDFNRRLSRPGDRLWSLLDSPGAPGDLSLAAGERKAQCDPKYSEFIDHIALDARLEASAATFQEALYAGERLSDHCPILVTITP